MIQVQKTYELSERRACQAIGQPRTTQRYAGQRTDIDGALSCRISELSRENPRYGYCRVGVMLDTSSSHSILFSQFNLLVLGGAQMPQGRMSSPSVVEALNVLCRKLSQMAACYSKWSMAGGGLPRRREK